VTWKTPFGAHVNFDWVRFIVLPLSSHFNICAQFDNLASIFELSENMRNVVCKMTSGLLSKKRKHIK
jgi:hypothetical protein